MANGLSKRTEEMQDRYVQARISGASANQARDIAGYSPNSNPVNLDKPNGILHSKIIDALKKKGIDDDYLATKYFELMEECSDPRYAKLKDLNAKCNALKQLGYLLGHGKRDRDRPAVAVQINNSTGKAQAHDAGTTSELISEVRDLVDAIRAETKARESAGVHEGSVEVGDAYAHPDVGPALANDADAGSRGGT